MEPASFYRHCHLCRAVAADSLRAADEFLCNIAVARRKKQRFCPGMRSLALFKGGARQQRSAAVSQALH